MKKLKKFISCIMAFLLMSITVNSTAIAKSISVIGTTANDAIVTDDQGTDFTGK